MASKSVIHPGEESESSAEEVYSDDELVTSTELEEIDTSAADSEVARAASGPQQWPVRPPPRRQPNSILHHKLREANQNLQSSAKSLIVTPYQRATRNVQNLTYSLSKIQASMSEACLHLQQIRDQLRATEEKTLQVVSSDYLVDVKI